MAGAFYDFVTRGEAGSEYVRSFRWHLADADWISPTTVAGAREPMSDLRFRAEYEGEWASGGDLLFTRRALDRVTADYALDDLASMTGPARVLAGVDWGAVHDRSTLVAVGRLPGPERRFAVRCAQRWVAGYPLSSVVDEIVGSPAHFDTIVPETNASACRSRRVSRPSFVAGSRTAGAPAARVGPTSTARSRSRRSSAAGALDVEAHDRRDRDTCLRRPLLATLVFAGLRISEALSLRWRDVDLAGGRLRVIDSKTDAGVRWVPIVPALRGELIARKLSTKFDGVDELVFTTTRGGKLSRDNTRTRILGKAHENADAALLAADLAPLPERLTQHSLRHTYISLRVALGHNLAAISRDAGHADINVTFRIYTHVMSLDEGDRERLRALVDGVEWAPMGTGAADVARETAS